MSNIITIDTYNTKNGSESIMTYDSSLVMLYNNIFLMNENVTDVIIDIGMSSDSMISQVCGNEMKTTGGARESVVRVYDTSVIEDDLVCFEV